VTTYRAARIHRFGSPEVIALEELAPVAPGRDEVLVRVHAAGVGPWDGWIRAGKSVLPQPLPLTLGSDLSGVVQAVGSEVAHLAVGDEVYGVTNPRFTDAYAELAIARGAMLAKKPRTLGHIEAASLPVISATAWQMLFDHARIEAGMDVLVHGGGGNVGAFAVQLAHQHGARVSATATGDLTRLRALGADVVIDGRKERFEDHVGSVDAVIDTVGGDTLARSLSVLKPGGILVSAVAQPDAAEAERRGVRGRFILVDVHTRVLEAIGARIDRGELRTHVGSVLPLSAAREAHEMLEGTRPHAPGKIVLKVRD
jgi:NADPH:quinone reductase-like Zn-dependent oxidoreductase